MSYTHIFFLCGLILLVGCDQQTLDTLAPPEAPTAHVNASVVVNGYTIEFLGADSVAAGVRFSYHVSGVNPGPPALNYFFLENRCEEAPVAWSPSASASVGVNGDTGLSGVQWNRGLGRNQTRIYSYTFADATLGVTTAVIRRGSQVATGVLPGPCGEAASLTGSVFVDADGDPDRAPNELGIGEVLVEVYDGSSLVASTVTDSTGAYRFALPPSQFTTAGAYTVRVPESGEEAFNSVLYGSYDYVLGGIADTTLVLGEDVDGVDFGFVANPDNIVFQLTQGDFRTAARKVQFWETLLRQIINGLPCNHGPQGTDCEAEVGSYLEIILDDADSPTDPFYLLATPFELPSGEEPIVWAFDLLRVTPATTLEAILQKTLAGELSRHAFVGSPDPAYDDVFFSYIEEWIANNSGESGNASGDVTPEEVELMLDAYLRGGGGGPIID